MAADPALLTDLPLFAALLPEELELLAQSLDQRHLEAGACLFKEGEPGQAMYIVASGCVELSVVDRAGQKIILSERGPGDGFGELSMLDAGPRSATARAIDPSLIIELDRDDLLRLVTKRPEAALHMLEAMGAMTRKADLLLRTRVSRNPSEEIADRRSFNERLTDGIATFSGSTTFLALSALWFAVWIGAHVLGWFHFDPYPFGLLTMIVSLEAIFLSIILLLASNRQAAKDRLRDDIEYDVNVKAELEIAHLHEKVEDLQEQIRERLERIERVLGVDG